MHTEHELVLEQLRAAFPAIELDSEGAFTSWGMTYLDGEEYAKQLSGKRWDALDRAYLALRSDTLGFLGTKTGTGNAARLALDIYWHQFLEGKDGDDSKYNGGGGGSSAAL